MRGPRMLSDGGSESNRARAAHATVSFLDMVFFICYRTQALRYLSSASARNRPRLNQCRKIRYSATLLLSEAGPLN